MYNNNYTLKLVTIILAFFIILVALLSPVKTKAITPSFSTSPYSNTCNYATNFPIPNWAINTKDLSGATTPTWWQSDNGWKSPKIQALLIRPTTGTFYTLIIADGSKVELAIKQSGDPNPTVNAQNVDGTNLASGNLRWFNIAYSGSTTSGWQQTAGTSFNWTDVQEICGYTSGVIIDRSQSVPSATTKTWRKYFPWNDGNTLRYGSQWQFMETPTTEPITTSVTSESLTQTQYEETSVKLIGVTLAILIGAAVVLAFRYR